MTDPFDTARFSSLRDAFEHIAALAPARRDAAIATACGLDAELERELRAMLEAHDREVGRTGQNRARMLEVVRDGLDPSAAPGERVGPYVLREILGRGGMGIVYRAERADGEVKQQVAVKVMQRMHLAEAGVRRFAQERDIVAQLAHPYVARLFDAGTTREGAPWYAMELIEGASIVGWCDAHKVGVGGRLELFLKVCDAVRFAHANLVLHRDIKPANVLVDASGTPKLIDFGIAKAMTAADATQTGLQLFTPSNAAPEQVRGERCGVACDVYQLGTLLYELLTGRTTLGDAVTSPAAIETAILHMVPTLPSEVLARRGDPAAALLRGDLDTIVLRALRKEPEQRYASVEQLADELRRYLRDEPIAARGGERAYRLRKFVRRNRAALAAGTVIVALIATVIAVQVVQSRRLERERDAAEAASVRAQAVSKLLTDVFTSADPGNSLDRGTSIGQVLDRGVARVEEGLADDPQLRLPLLGVLAEVYSNLDDSTTATKLVDQGMAVLDASPRLDDRVRAEFLERAARIRSLASDIKGSHAAALAAVAAHERLGDPPARQIEARQSLNLATLAMQDRSTWRQGALELLAYFDSDPSIDPIARARANAFVANRLIWAGATEEAVPMLRESLAVLEHALPANHEHVLSARYGLGLALVRSGRVDEGLPLLETAAAGWADLYGDDSALVARVRVRVAEGQIALGRLADAEATGKQALAAARKARRWPHSDIQVAESLLGEIYRHTENWPLSERYFRDALRSTEAVAGPGSANVVDMRRGLAIALFEQGRLDEAASVLEPARPLVDFSTPQHAEWAILYAKALHDLHREAESARLIEQLRPYMASEAAAAEPGLRERYASVRDRPDERVVPVPIR